MNDSESNPAGWSGGLSDLFGVTLDAEHQAIFDRAAAGCGGPAVWQQRKLIEFREYLALSLVSGRITTAMADLRGPLRIVFELQVTVPTLPDPAGELVVTHHALLGLNYDEEALRLPLPGYAFMTLLQPSHLFLANAAPPGPGLAIPGQGQVICLGPEIAAGTPVKEIILRTFGALTLQSVQLDERDAAGVMNPTAAAWWLQNRDRMPLTREGFLEFNPPPGS